MPQLVPVPGTVRRWARLPVPVLGTRYQLGRSRSEGTGTRYVTCTRRCSQQRGRHVAPSTHDRGLSRIAKQAGTGIHPEQQAAIYRGVTGTCRAEESRGLHGEAARPPRKRVRAGLTNRKWIFFRIHALLVRVGSSFRIGRALLGVGLTHVPSPCRCHG